MTEQVGLLGWPVAHSISPALHNAAFEALGLDWHYVLIPAAPDELHETIARHVADGWRGFNVTIPHKQAIMDHPLVRAISPAAQVIGAGNTLVVGSDGSLTVDNTDWAGFLADLHAHEIDPAGRTCVILGTGGSAKGVRYALEQAGAAQVTQISRSPGDRADVVGYNELPRLAQPGALIVNCTPLGMWPEIDRSPWPDDVPISPDLVLYDLVYNPSLTRLMREIRVAGGRAVGGLGMLVQQGALAQVQWTGITPPVDVMAAAARAAMGMHSARQRSRLPM